MPWGTKKYFFISFCVCAKKVAAAAAAICFSCRCLVSKFVSSSLLRAYAMSMWCVHGFIFFVLYFSYFNVCTFFFRCVQFISVDFFKLHFIFCILHGLTAAAAVIVICRVDDLQSSYSPYTVRYVLMRSILRTWNARDERARVQLLSSSSLLAFVLSFFRAFPMFFLCMLWMSVYLFFSSLLLFHNCCEQL